MNMPRDFFETIVRLAYQDWRAEPLAQHRAKAAFGFADAMAERMYIHLGLENDFPRPAQYRDARTKECPDFGLLRDISDGT